MDSCQQDVSRVELLHRYFVNNYFVGDWRSDDVPTGALIKPLSDDGAMYDILQINIDTRSSG